MYQRDLDDLDAQVGREGHVALDENDEAIEEQYVYQIPEGQTKSPYLLCYVADIHRHRSKIGNIFHQYDYRESHDRYRYLLYSILDSTGHKQHRCGALVLGLGRANEFMVRCTQRCKTSLFVLANNYSGYVKCNVSHQLVTEHFAAFSHTWSLERRYHGLAERKYMSVSTVLGPRKTSCSMAKTEFSSKLARTHLPSAQVSCDVHFRQ